MATGYTYKIEEGDPNFTFRDFAMGCAGAFGALYHLRDEPRDTPYRPQEVTSYHTESLARARQELAQWREKTLQEAQEEFNHTREAQIKSYRESILKKLALEERYEVFLKEAQAWEPPTPEHKRFKEFMIEQLTSSIDWDCDAQYCYKGIQHWETLTFEEWAQSRESTLVDGIAHHIKGEDLDIRRARENNKWAQDLFDSLK